MVITVASAKLVSNKSALMKVAFFVTPAATAFFFAN